MIYYFTENTENLIYAIQEMKNLVENSLQFDYF